MHEDSPLDSICGEKTKRHSLQRPRSFRIFTVIEMIISDVSHPSNRMPLLSKTIHSNATPIHRVQLLTSFNRTNANFLRRIEISPGLEPRDRTAPDLRLVLGARLLTVERFRPDIDPVFAGESEDCSLAIQNATG